MNDRRYAMNVAVCDMAFWREPRHTWQRIGSVTPGLETLFGGPRDDDASKQIEELELLISQDVSGIVVFSSDPKAIAPTINKAVEKGIPVVTAFADVPESKRLAHVGTNQTELAEAIARRVLNDHSTKVRPDAHVLVCVGKRDADDQKKRSEGISRVIDGQMKLLDPIQDEFKASTAESAVLDAFREHSNIGFIFGCNSQSAIGAVRALKKIGKNPGEVIVTGWDSEEMVMREIKAVEMGKGWIHATAVLYSSYMVQACFSILEAENFGYLYPDTLLTRELRLPGVPATLQIPMKDVVTPKNVDEYLGKK